RAGPPAAGRRGRRRSRDPKTIEPDTAGPEAAREFVFRERCGRDSRRCACWATGPPSPRRAGGPADPIGAVPRTRPAAAHLPRQTAGRAEEPPGGGPPRRQQPEPPARGQATSQMGTQAKKPALPSFVRKARNATRDGENHSSNEAFAESEGKHCSICGRGGERRLSPPLEIRRSEDQSRELRHVHRLSAARLGQSSLQERRARGV